MDSQLIQSVLIEALKTERMRQDNKWGEQNHAPGYWARIFAEEYGEASKCYLEGDMAGYRRETIEAAAVLLAELECHDRLSYLTKQASQGDQGDDEPGGGDDGQGGAGS